MSQAEWHFSVSSEGLSVGVRRYNVVLTRPLRVQCCSRARNDSYKSICEVSLRFSARKRQQQCDRMRSCIPRPLLSGMKRRCLQSEIVDRSALGSSHFSADSRYGFVSPAEMEADPIDTLPSTHCRKVLPRGARSLLVSHPAHAMANRVQGEELVRGRTPATISVNWEHTKTTVCQAHKRGVLLWTCFL